jgi:hypothetical protein
MLVGERPHFLTVNNDRANQFFLFEHWHCNKGPRAGLLDGNDAQRSSSAILSFASVEEGLQRRATFAELPRFNVLRRCVFIALPAALSRRLIVLP